MWRTLGVIMLVLASSMALAYPLDCYQEPSAPECESFTASAAYLADDLDVICKPVVLNSLASGWPAACTLHHECRAGRAEGTKECLLLRLLLTACSESPELPSCPKYMGLCSPASVVQQCRDAQPFDSLPTANRAYVDVQSMCGAAAGADECTGCKSRPTADPGHVGLQSVTITCPNPFGSLSQLCLLNSSGEVTPGCESWVAFCGSAEGSAFPALCVDGWEEEEDAAAQLIGISPAPTPPPFVPMPLYPKRSAAYPESEEPDCYSVPGDPACADFRQLDATSREQLAALCSAMPAMVGCTLWAACKTGSAAGRFCAPFSLLGDICAADMPDMRGCEGFVSLCGNESSVVGQCTAEGPIKHVLLSGETTRAVLDMCSTHAMPQCAQCPSRFKCPDPLSTLSAMCLEMPTMSECSKFFAMCDEAGDTFTGLCGGSGAGGGGSTLPPMRMYLHQGVADIILFKWWVPRSTASYAASCIAVLLTGVFVQALKAWRMMVEASWVRQRASGHAQACGGAACPGGALGRQDDKEVAPGSSRWSDASGLDVPLLVGGARLMSRGQARRNVVRSVFTIVIVFLDYMLMLIVMTFNVGIIVSAVLGFGLGALLFGHVGEPSQPRMGGMANLLGSMLGAPDPDPENSLEIQYVRQQSCCSGH